MTDNHDTRAYKRSCVNDAKRKIGHGLFAAALWGLRFAPLPWGKSAARLSLLSTLVNKMGLIFLGVQCIPDTVLQAMMIM